MLWYSWAGSSRWFAVPTNHHFLEEQSPFLHCNTLKHYRPPLNSLPRRVCGGGVLERVKFTPCSSQTRLRYEMSTCSLTLSAASSTHSASSDFGTWSPSAVFINVSSDISASLRCWRDVGHLHKSDPPAYVTPSCAPKDARPTHYDANDYQFIT